MVSHEKIDHCKVARVQYIFFSTSTYSVFNTYAANVTVLVEQDTHTSSIQNTACHAKKLCLLFALQFSHICQSFLPVLLVVVDEPSRLYEVCHV